jgi:hypothetical protein
MEVWTKYLIDAISLSLNHLISHPHPIIVSLILKIIFLKKEINYRCGSRGSSCGLRDRCGKDPWGKP